MCVCVCVCVCARARARVCVCERERERELQYDHLLVYGFYVTVDEKCISDFDDSVDISTLF